MFLPRARRLAPLLAAIVGCTPTLDWRTVLIDAGSLQALFPCRPQHRSRAVTLGGLASKMEMNVCSADADTFALSFVDASDPSGVSPMLGALRHAASDNLGAPVPSSRPFAPAGATPNAASGRVQIEGRLPDGKRVVEHAAFFIRGLRIYQANVIGPAPAADAVETFFSSLKLAP
jgi:hypothetical protein